MQGSIQEQNASITETSAALTEISANISNINIIANKRRAGMNEIVNALDAQMSLIRDIVDKVEKVQQSSDGIAAFVNTVDSIASQTGLLAMNASIEAAHAGTLGKGFSVIAQEIRKLSEETTKNAALISETLKVNTEVVSSTTASVSTFAEHTKKSAEEIKTTVHAIEEILAGISEMDTGTQEIMKSLQTIVDEARLNADLVSSVTKEITEQSDSINNISNFASEMESKVAGLDDYIRNIKIAIADIKKDAEQNNIVTEEINKIMQ
jgi:methyl-accepting chemotaxis protein